MNPDNKLIAEFLGYSQPHPDYPDTTYWYKKDFPPLTILSFDTDWNWLMQVVEAINDLNNVVEIHENHVRIVNNIKSKVLVDVVEGTMKLAVYQAVIEFIKWYNEQPK